MSIGNPSLQPCSALAVAPIRRARRIHRPTRTWTPGTSAYGAGAPDECGRSIDDGSAPETDR